MEGLKFEIRSEKFSKKLILTTTEGEIHITVPSKEDDYSPSITLTLDKLQQIKEGLERLVEIPK